ncbi:hypothetical protein CVT25_010284 [Psilocybe cyanescens]|uniref:Uncharacterized protein n=1 Tax=Psilocybe cyanescens TaxID=93625 RepID=A0A409X2T9_PSICY|nr:hypothetical protein CVT25_010284 [Psilocybe cyanescens]
MLGDEEQQVIVRRQQNAEAGSVIATAPDQASGQVPVAVPVAPLIELASSPFIVPSSYPHRILIFPLTLTNIASLTHTSTNMRSCKGTNTININITSAIITTGICVLGGGAVK